MLSELKEAKNKVVGIKQVMRAAESEELTCIYIAEDTDDELRAALLNTAHVQKIRYVMAASRAELGEACLIQVPAACAGILKQN